MKLFRLSRSGAFLFFCFFLTTLPSFATIYYVATNGNDSADGTNWPTAKATIQAAIDVSVSNDLILVSNGVYETGGRVVYGAMTNRVAITNAVTVQSVNGPEVTIIKGARNPATTNGDAAVRCVYVGTNAVLSGFTLTNGATRAFGGGDIYLEQSGGGAWCETSAILSNCTLTGNSVAYGGGGAWYGTLNNCTLIGNLSGWEGGGADGGTLNNCTLTNNFALQNGGGVCNSTLNNCTLIGNSASNYMSGSDGSGGGAARSTLNDCALIGNSAEYGGGSFGDFFGGTLNNCTLMSNSAYSGGGSAEDILNNCTLIGNSASDSINSYNGNGGGAVNSRLNNCALIGNSAQRFGGGYCGGGLSSTVSNCIFTGNSASYGGGAAFSKLYSCILTSNSAISGGGAYYGYGVYTLDNCTLIGNSAEFGGGACGQTSSGRATLNNCTLSANSARTNSGGAYYCTLYNGIVYFNTAPTNANYSDSTLSYCCTTPDPGGTGNITNDPQFVNAAASDYHLGVSSPCIDRGTNAYVHRTSDLDGNPRIVHGVVDIGAYEFQGYWAWIMAITNGLTNLDECATGDGYPNLLKYVTGSSPTNPDELARLDCGTGSGWFSLCFNRNTNAADVTLIVEGTSALTNGATWNGIATNINGSWGGATNVAEIGTTNPLTVAVQDADFAGTATSRYLRLHVTRP